ncbi:protein ecdysoneless homolog isoform X2 [Trichomycterus rosablanca]|uniref:protein ecdysoneless homolog isoform X2 n=1 Tax=Trichomycterus rosablanca TaxID=2290929 RepID=UPI002F356A64
MDFLKRPPVQDDAVQYKLFPLHMDAPDAEENQPRLRKLLELILAEIAPLLVGYIWQQQPFNLSFHPEKGNVPAHLGGSTVFGDNVEDEWFIVYLLKRITQTFTELAASVQDNDGQFLLIEAADFLPKWLDPDSSENRVFLYRGELHILPDRARPGEAGWPRDSVPTVREALQVLHTHGGRCVAEQSIRSAIERRVQGYPGNIRTGLHRAHCYIPAGIAAVLSRRPDLVAPAVSAFYLRDPFDLQACRTFRNFPPDSRVLASVTFTRCLYAQLQQQSFVPDRRSGYALPPRSHPHHRAHDLGMKLAHGFEILCSKSERGTVGAESPVSTNPLWRGFLDSLKRNGYFREELEGSLRYRELMTSAEDFFKRSVTNTKDSPDHGPGEEVLRVLENTSYSLEELKEKEAHLPPEDSDEWLNISPQELDRLLEERGGQRSSLGSNVQRGAGRSEDEEQQEEEAGYTLVAVTQGMKNFINAVSSHEGAEFPRSCLSEPFSFDPETMTSTLDRLLGGQAEELDSDDFDDDDDDEEEEEDEVVKEGPQTQTGAETLDSLRKYMDEMDQELQTTNVGQSFKGGAAGGRAPDGPGWTEDDLRPLDVDVNLVTNLLESLSSQAGLAGPASNLLHSLGLRLPPNADPS